MSKEIFIQEQYKTYKAKNVLYGNSFIESIEKYGDVAFATRVDDKIRRIRQLLSNEDLSEAKSVVKEGLEDAIRDTFNYICMMDAYKTNCDVLDSMKNSLNYNNEILEHRLFNMYGEKLRYLLNPDSKEDRALFDTIKDMMLKLCELSVDIDNSIEFECRSGK